MKNNPVTELVPVVESEGWHWLVGHRRYQHWPTGTSGPWIMTFLKGAGIRVVGGDPRSLEMKAIRFNNFLIAHVRTPPVHFRWTRDRRPAQSRHMLLFVNHGSITIGGGAEHWASPGGGLCIVFPGTETVDIQSTEKSEVILFTFDQSEVAPYMLTPSKIADIRPGTTVFRASYAYLQATVDVPQVAEQPEEATEVLRTLTREVARALAKSFLVPDDSEATFVHAQRMVDQHSLEPEFDVDALAARCQISRRTLDRIYARHDLSPAQEIRRSRAQRAIPLLAESMTLTLEEVATASGFRSITTMNRALKWAYGLSAGALRQTSTPSGDHGAVAALTQ